MAEPCASAKRSSSAGLGSHPAAQGETGRLEIDRQAVSASMRSCSTSSCSAPTTPTMAPGAVVRQEQLHDALLGQLPQRLAQLLGLHGVGQLDAAQDLGREARHAAEDRSSPSVSVSPMRKRAVVRDADHVAREGLLGGDAVLGEEELRRRQAERLAGAHQLGLHAALELPEQTRMKAMRSRWFGSMLAWILNTKPVMRVLVGGDVTLVGVLAARRRREGRQRVDEIARRRNS